MYWWSNEVETLTTERSDTDSLGDLKSTHSNKYLISQAVYDWVVSIHCLGWQLNRLDLNELVQYLNRFLIRNKSILVDTALIWVETITYIVMLVVSSVVLGGLSVILSLTIFCCNRIKGYMNKPRISLTIMLNLCISLVHDDWIAILHDRLIFRYLWELEKNISNTIIELRTHVQVTW